MDKEKLQALIDSATEPEQMLTVARSYLRGEVLHDKIAAEAWLMKVIDLEEPVRAAEAMGLLAREILGEAPLFPDEARYIRSRLETADKAEKQTLLALLDESRGDHCNNFIDYNE